jgi:hypothetical protein
MAQIHEALEELDDIRAYDKARSTPSSPFPSTKPAKNPHNESPLTIAFLLRSQRKNIQQKFSLKNRVIKSIEKLSLPGLCLAKDIPCIKNAPSVKRCDTIQN